MAETSPNPMPTKELRIGLVLYGGVSLAIYMNGIVTEIWNALRAARGAAPAADRPGGATAPVYAELLAALSGAGGTERLDIVVDTVAGTSAGGVNGTVLAKAVVEGGDARVLNTVWIEDAGIEALKDDPPRTLGFFARLAVDAASLMSEWLRGLRNFVDALPGLSWGWVRDQAYSLASAKDGTKTPLDGQYFAEMIAKTLAAMAAAPGPRLIGPDQRFDLFLTRTDFHGWPRHLPVSRLFHRDALYERTHAHVMAFAPAGGGGLDADFALTYATRTTAGFPGAFAPVGYQAMAAAFRAARPGETPPSSRDFAHRYLREHELAGPDFPPDHAWMIDGGVLDNKPFGHVADAIERKPAARQVYRIVLYVEPSPEARIEGPPDAPPTPGAVAGGLYRLFRHEPIYDDLRRLYDRNAKVARIRDIADAAAAAALHAAQQAGEAAGLSWEPSAEALDDWRRATNEALARRPDPAYPGYVALKARRAAGVLAGLACRALDFPYHSRHAYFVRALTRAWLGAKGWTAPPAFDTASGDYRLADGQRALLDAFDLPFRRRRLRALVGAANREYVRRPASGADPGRRRPFLDDFKRALAQAAARLDRIEEEALDDIRATIGELLGALDDSAVDAAIARLQDEARDALVATYDDALTAAYRRIAGRLQADCGEVNRAIVAAIRAIPHDGVRPRLARAYVVFPFLDRVVYPLMESAGLEDLVEIEAMRVSPLDAELLRDAGNPLQGNALGAFAGFLRRTARENDLLWGRLHGAERLVDLIARAAVADDAQYAALADLRARFKTAAISAILDDEARRPATSIAPALARIRAALAAPPAVPPLV